MNENPPREPIQKTVYLSLKSTWFGETFYASIANAVVVKEITQSITYVTVATVNESSCICFRWLTLTGGG